MVSSKPTHEVAVVHSHLASIKNKKKEIVKHLAMQTQLHFFCTIVAVVALVEHKLTNLP